MSENHGPKRLGPGWEHLFVQDRRTEEERKATEAKDRARRRGRGLRCRYEKLRTQRRIALIALALLAIAYGIYWCMEPGKVHDAATDVPPIAGLASSSAAFDAIIRLSLTCAHFRPSCRGRLGENDNRRGFDGSGNRCFGSDCSYCSLATGWARTTTGRGAMDSLAR